MSIRIHIQRLTVEGASRAQAARAGEALRAHLSELTLRGISPQISDIERLDAGEIRADDLDGAGRHAAERIFGHLGGKGDRHG